MKLTVITSALLMALSFGATGCASSNPVADNLTFTEDRNDVRGCTAAREVMASDASHDRMMSMVVTQANASGATHVLTTMQGTGACGHNSIGMQCARYSGTAYRCADAK